MDVVGRRAGRVLLIDDAGRVLMIRGFNPDKPGEFYWFTPGGGADAHETTAQAAARELGEETGLRVGVGDLVGPIYSEEIDLPFGGVLYRQAQDFFVVRVSEWTVDPAGLDDVELGTIDEFRWLSVDDVAAEIAGPDPVYPPDLEQILRIVIG